MVEREKLSVRTYQPDDLLPVAALYQIGDLASGDQHRIDAQELRLITESPEVDAANDAFVVEHDGQIIAFAYCEWNASTGRGWADAVVHPDHWAQGLGTELLQRTEARILAHGQAELSPERTITVQRGAAEANENAIRLFESQGYRRARGFYRMRIDFNSPVDVPPLPNGLLLRPFDPARDGYAVYQAHQEAFADHWGFEPNTFEEWAHYLLQPETDFSLWLIAYDGDQIAGICLNRPYGGDDPQMAWVRILAVRRPWRKRGLGLALLKQSFARFRERGYRRAGLGVDASSLTNAVALYERAGMYVYKRVFSYRKTLRGAEPST